MYKNVGLLEENIKTYPELMDCEDNRNQMSKLEYNIVRKIMCKVYSCQLLKTSKYS